MKKRKIILADIYIFLFLFALSVFSIILRNEKVFVIVFYIFLLLVLINIIFLLRFICKFLKSKFCPSNNNDLLLTEENNSQVTEKQLINWKRRILIILVVLFCLPVCLLIFFFILGLLSKYPSLLVSFACLLLKILLPIIGLYIVGRRIGFSMMTLKKSALVIINFLLWLLIVIIITFPIWGIVWYIGGVNLDVAVRKYGLIVYYATEIIFIMALILLGFPLFYYQTRKKLLEAIDIKKTITLYVAIVLFFFISIIIGRIIDYRVAIKPGKCQEKSDINWQKNCYINRAKKLKKLELCDDDKLASVKEYCYINVAAEKKDPTICDAMSDQIVKSEMYNVLTGSYYTESDRDHCYFRVSLTALYRSDAIPLCEKISNGVLKGYCYKGGVPTDY